MREIQKCRRCGHVFCEIERSGPSPVGLGHISLHAGEKLCPRCGGPVVWVDESGSPLSAYKRLEEANWHQRQGCLLLAIIVLLGLILSFVVQ
ncbi:MAG: hypothetical protein ABSB30_10530 [Terracidiphilus sp.]